MKSLLQKKYKMLFRQAYIDLMFLGHWSRSYAFCTPPICWFGIIYHRNQLKTSSFNYFALKYTFIQTMQQPDYIVLRTQNPTEKTTFSSTFLHIHFSSNNIILFFFFPYTKHFTQILMDISTKGL